MCLFDCDNTKGSNLMTIGTKTEMKERYPKRELAKSVEQQGIMYSTVLGGTLADSFIRPAIVVEPGTTVSFDICDTDGKIIARVNVSSSAEMNWRNVDVIPSDTYIPTIGTWWNGHRELTHKNRCGQLVSVDLRLMKEE